MAETKSWQQVTDQIGHFFGSLTGRQKLLLGAGALLVAGTLWGFVRLIGEPRYATLYSGLRGQDAQSMVARLNAKNIPSRLSPDGASLMVPAEQLDAARLETAAQGLPNNARLGFELFDTPNWAGSDFSEKVNYQRALEGELERTLQTLGEVESVRVHLVMPRESLFTEQERAAKAAVIVKTRGGALSPVAQTAIPHLVASAVDGLRPENVTVVDADSNAALSPSRNGAAGGAVAELDHDLANTVVRTLEPVVGADHVRASVHVEYDTGSSESTEEIYDPKATAATSTQKSEETAGGASPKGIPGTASNVPGSQPGNGAVAVLGESDSQSSRSESATYAVSKSVKHTVQPAGRLKRITAAVLIDDAVDAKDQNGKPATSRRKRTPDEMKELERLASAAIGIDSSRGDLLAVENISFRELPVEKPVPPTWLDKLRKLLSDWAAILRYVGVTILFLLVYALVLRPVKKQALEAFRQLPAQAATALKSQHDGFESEPVTGELADTARRAKQLKQQLTERVKQEPAVASRLVQSWMKEG